MKECWFGGCFKSRYTLKGLYCRQHHRQLLKTGEVWELKEFLETNGLKRCTVCKTAKSKDEFALWNKVGPKTSVDGIKSQCRECLRQLASNYAKAGKYGLQPGDYEKMVVDQNGLCGICKSENPSGGNPRVTRFVIDHDHKCCSGGNSCGKCVRGLLCNRCNRALGLFRDDAELLKNATQWLEKSFG